MDPVSHAAFGRTLAALDGRQRLGAGATTACVLGALCPDLDISRAYQGWDVYLRHHQSGTHSLIGAIACGLLTGSVVRLFARGGRWTRLVAAGTIGAASHVTLDLVSGADLRLFAPFVDRLVTLPLFAMADPWLLGALILAAIAASFARRRGALAGLALVVLLVSIKGGFYVRANGLERAATGSTATHADAVFGSWARWTYLETHAATVDRWDIDAGTGSAVRSATIARQLDEPLATRSRVLPTVANLLASHDDTFARVVARPDGSHDVRWSALRYCSVGGQGSEPVCGLWFGGEYDAAGRPIAATVWIGSFVQRRAGRTPSDNE